MYFYVFPTYLSFHQATPPAEPVPGVEDKDEEQMTQEQEAEERV